MIAGGSGITMHNILCAFPSFLHLVEFKYCNIALELTTHMLTEMCFTVANKDKS
jgi:hypothetical protein